GSLPKKCLRRTNLRAGRSRKLPLERRAERRFLELEVRDGCDSRSGGIDTSCSCTTRDNKHLTDDADGLRSGTNIHRECFARHRGNKLIYFGVTRLHDRLVKFVPAIDLVGYCIYTEAGCASTENFNNCRHLCRKSKILSHCDAMVQIERKLSAFLRVRQFNQNALGRLASYDDIVIRYPAACPFSHEQSLPGSNFERDTLPRLSKS